MCICLYVCVCVCVRERERLILRNWLPWLRGLASLRSEGQVGRLETQGRVDAAAWVHRLSGFRIPSPLGGLSLFLKTFRWLKEAHPHYGGQLYVHARMLSHFSHVWLFATLWTIACQASLFMGFSRQEYRSALLCDGGQSAWLKADLISILNTFAEHLE